VRDLLDLLGPISSGPVIETSDLESLLATYWSEFVGSEAEGMTGEKLLGRIENVVWNPPVLEFQIERHGGTVMGSTRAEIQAWSLDVERRIARVRSAGVRQLRPKRQSLDVTPLAERIIAAIVMLRDDDWLGWLRDGSARVLIGRVIPDSSAARQTVEGRRKRLRDHLREGLADHRWREVRANVYKKTD